MARRRISRHTGQAALTAWAGGDQARRTLATATRFLLEELAEQAPGSSVEVRVPPFGVAQCVEGPRHTRGTPPNVVEFDAQTWIQLATGRTAWAEAQGQGTISASGTRADLTEVLPLVRSSALLQDPDAGGYQGPAEL
ncbi:MAG: sterol carrier family protein [Nesterenkonia sp.]